jgi:hypothetical protein
MQRGPPGLKLLVIVVRRVRCLRLMWRRNMKIEKADHRQMAQRLEQRAFAEPADTDAALRRAAGARAVGGAAIDPAYDMLVRQIGEASYKVTDAQVTAAVRAAGSERAAFEIVAAACVGTALKRWSAGLSAIEEAANAPR